MLQLKLGGIYDPLEGDSFIASQPQSRMLGTEFHVVGTRFTSDKIVTVEQLVVFHTELKRRSKLYNGDIVMQTMLNTKELVLFVRVPTTVSETKFVSLIEDFKQALAKAGIAYRPIMCPIDANVRFLFAQ
jgi:hypothetical protein